jgi:uncharacterized membrane protein YeaQ/YmgE (transglycosylase-associated protein family)
MNEPLTAFGNPSFGFFMMLLIGAVAGWIGEKVTRSDHGLFTNILVGIAGSFVATRAAEALGVVVGGTFGHIIAAAVGAIAIIFVWRAISGARG